MKHKKVYLDYSYRRLTVKAIAYSMISVCISADKMPVEAACGLTLHQFLKQCRVSKAQRLLEDGKSVAEAVNIYQKALNGGCPLYMIYSQYKRKSVGYIFLQLGDLRKQTSIDKWI